MVWFQLDPPGAVWSREPNPSQLPLDGHTSPSRGLCLDPESLLALRKRRQTRVQLLVDLNIPAHFGVKTVGLFGRYVSSFFSRCFCWSFFGTGFPGCFISPPPPLCGPRWGPLEYCRRTFAPHSEPDVGFRAPWCQLAQA